MIITSTSNQKIREIRKLKDKKFRNETGKFFVEGIRIVIEALEESDDIEEIICCKEMLKNESGIKALQEAEKKRIPIVYVSTEVFETLSNKEGPQGLAAVVSITYKTINDIDPNKEGTWVALFEVADPGNLGTILRTIDGAGANGLFLIGNCTDPYDPSAIRASMGTIFSKPIIRISESDFSQWIQAENIDLIGTSDSSKFEYSRIQYPKRMILLMGSEREGLPSTLEKLCKHIVSIPMLGKSDSLNLSVATGIILYEINRQNQKETLRKK